MSDNKYEFTAKRLDNSSLTVTGRLGYGRNGLDVIEESMPNGNVYSHDIDPSTITPLFTTDKPDAWLFENADKLPLNELTPAEALLVMGGLLEGGLETYGAQWVDNERMGIFIENVYRVRAPGYSADDLKIKISSILPDPNINLQPVWDEIDKCAKANGWQR